MTLYQEDPFLQLVGDCKLQAVNAGVDHPSKVYGSEEDNEDALKSLSAIEKVTIENLSEEFFTSLIAESIARLSKVTFIALSCFKLVLLLVIR